YVAFSPIDDRLATSGEDATVQLWDLSTRTAITLSQRSTSASRLTIFAPDGATVVATRDDSARVIDVTGAHYRKLRGLNGAITAAAFDADGGRLLLAGKDGTARLFQIKLGGSRVFRLPSAGVPGMSAGVPAMSAGVPAMSAVHAISAAAGDVVSLS